MQPARIAIAGGSIGGLTAACLVVHLEGGAKIETDLLVCADGVGSCTRARLQPDASRPARPRRRKTTGRWRRRWKSSIP